MAGHDPMTQHVLFYKPPCGVWYVHSHKLYPSVEAAREDARKFLRPGTTIAICPLRSDLLVEELVL